MFDSTRRYKTDPILHIVSDGDSGSWIVDELRLEVHGHVVADDVFGDAYVIPMNDILNDIQRCLGAKSVDLPSRIDIISMAAQQQPSTSFGRPYPIDSLRTLFAERRREHISALSDIGEDIQFVREFHAVKTMASADLPTGRIQRRHQLISFLDRFRFLRPLQSVFTRKQKKQPGYTAPVKSTILFDPTWQRLMRDSGYSSLGGTPCPSPDKKSLPRT